LAKRGVIKNLPASQWNAQIMLIPKTGKLPEEAAGMTDPTELLRYFRLVVDFRGVNARLKPWHTQMPTIREMIANIAGKRLISASDMDKAYWQVAVHPDDQHKLAFRGPDGRTWTWVGAPMGLALSAAALAELTRELTSDVERAGLFADDLLHAADDEEQLLEDWKKLLANAERIGARLSPQKTMIGFEGLDKFGYRVSGQAVAIALDRAAAIREWAPVTDKPALKSFLGTVQYFSWLIPGYSEIAAPLHAMTSKTARFDAEKARPAIDRIKGRIVRSTEVSQPDYGKVFIVATDASEMGLGAVLLQPTDDLNHLASICFASRRLRGGECSASVFKKEMLGAIFAYQAFAVFLHGTPARTILATDHKPVQYVLDARSTDAQAFRLAERLLAQNPQVVYLRGQDQVADALSRFNRLDDARRVLNLPNEGVFASEERLARARSAG